MKHTDIFNDIHDMLDSKCCGNCGECAFLSATLCGMVVIRSMMAKMNGAANVCTGDPYRDYELMEFIAANQTKREE